jgi:hypothetical protein
MGVVDCLVVIYEWVVDCLVVIYVWVVDCLMVIQCLTKPFSCFRFHTCRLNNSANKIIEILNFLVNIVRHLCYNCAKFHEKSCRIDRAMNVLLRHVCENSFVAGSHHNKESQISHDCTICFLMWLISRDCGCHGV